MNRQRVLALLERVAAGAMAPGAAADALSLAPSESLGFATIDHHRALRQGYPEVIFAPGKTVEQVVTIAERIEERGDGCFVTRAESHVRSALLARFPRARVNDVGRTVLVAESSGGGSEAGPGQVLIVTAGTSDLPVAEEAAETVLAVGCTVARLTDVGAVSYTHLTLPTTPYV